MRRKQPKIIACSGMKGGVGKTTICVNLAAVLLARGRKVMLVDADPQRSAATWVDIRREHKHPLPTIMTAPQADLHQPKQLPTFAPNFDQILIDGPPRLFDMQRSILMVADLVLFPCAPTAPELWALRSSLEELATVRKWQRDNRAPIVGAAIVLNRTQPRTTSGRAARANLSADLDKLRAELLQAELPELGPLPILKTELALRIAHQEALCVGVGVTSYDPTSRAAAEFSALADEILAFEGADHGKHQAHPRNAAPTRRR